MAPVGDGPGEGTLEASEEALVSTTSNPPLRTSTSGAMPNLAPNIGNSPPGNYLLGPNLNQAPTNADANWVSRVAGDVYSTPTALPAQVNAALTSARSSNTTRWNEWGPALDGLKLASSFTGVSVSPGTATERSFAYTPERARWLDSETFVSPASIIRHTDPLRFAETRQRGARLYCAAKEAVARNLDGLGQSKTQMMGRKSLASISIIGKRIDFLTVEPTVALSSPKKFHSTANDGAQAFSIPLAVGARFAPTSLLPTFPEMRTPVTLVTTDAEVLTRANTSLNRIETWQTATHADALLSSSRTATIDPQPITLFMVGPLSVDMDMKFTLFSESCSQALRNGATSALASCRSTPQQPVRRLFDPAITGWPLARTGGPTGGSGVGTYNDDFWQMRSLGGEFWVSGISGQRFVLDQLTHPLGVRAFQDNDKSTEVRTGMTAEFSLAAQLRRQLGPVLFELGINGGMGGDASVVHSVREQEHSALRMQDNNEFSGLFPETSLSVTPRTEASLGILAVGTAKIEIDTFLGKIDIGGTLFSLSRTLADVRGANWAEDSRLRLGTYTTAPQLTSHWPKAPGTAAHTPFTALPTSTSACMAGAPSTNDLQAPCHSVRGTYPSTVATTAPRAEVCVLAPVNDPDWFWNVPADRCHLRLQAFVTGGTGMVQTVGGQVQRSRILNPNDSSWATPLQQAINGCVGDLGSREAVRPFIQTGMCDTSGRFFDISSAVSTTATTGDGSTMTPNVCSSEI